MMVEYQARGRVPLMRHRGRGERRGAEDADATALIERMYTQHSPRVFRHAYFLLGRRDDADDVTQETFVRAFSGLSRFQGRSDPATWLLRICTHLCYDFQRKTVRETRLEQSLPPLAIEPDPAETIAVHDTARRLLRVLDGLPATDRAALVLHLLDDLDYAQMALVLGCTKMGAKMRTLRALRRFKERAAHCVSEETA